MRKKLTETNSGGDNRRTLTWTNSEGDYEWSKGNNWNPSGPPQPDDNVIIPDRDNHGLTWPNSPTPPGIHIHDLDLGAIGLGSGGSLTGSSSFSKARNTRQ